MQKPNSAFRVFSAVSTHRGDSSFGGCEVCFKIRIFFSSLSVLLWLFLRHWNLMMASGFPPQAAAISTALSALGPRAPCLQTAT